MLAVVMCEHLAVLKEVKAPSWQMGGLKQAKWESTGPLLEPQPSIAAGVIGGSSPSLGRVMLDSGAGLSLMSSAVVQAHGLKVWPYHATFSVASGAQACITGEVDLELAVHPLLSLHLTGVKVQDMGDMYQFLLGADILRGASGILEEVQVVPDSRVEWFD